MKEMLVKYYGATLAEKIKNKLLFEVEPKKEYARWFAQKYPEYRLKYSGKHNGITLINDSGASSMDATYFSLQQLGRSVVWIVWNDDANIPVEELDWGVLQKVKKIIVIGKAFLKMQYFLENDLPVEEAGNLQDALRSAVQCAGKDDYVLFSPAGKKRTKFEDTGKLFKHVEELMKSLIK